MENDLDFRFYQREIELLQARAEQLLQAFLLAQKRQKQAEKDLRIFLEEVKI